MDFNLLLYLFLCFVKNSTSYYYQLRTNFFLLVFLTHASSILVTLVTFGAYFLLEERPLTPESVFSGLALFNQLTVPLFIFPITVPIIISAMVSPNDID